MKTLLNKLPQRFQFTIHNLIAHPLMEIFYQVGLHDLSELIHEITQPHEEQTLRDEHESEDAES